MCVSLICNPHLAVLTYVSNRSFLLLLFTQKDAILEKKQENHKKNQKFSMAVGMASNYGHSSHRSKIFGYDRRL